MQEFLPYTLIRGEYTESQKANIHIATHALHYGTGAFGGLRGVIKENAAEVILFRLDLHTQRLSQSASFFGLDWKGQEIENKLIDFIKKNKPTKDFYLRPLIYASDPVIAKFADLDFDLAIFGIYLGDYLSPNGISCTLSSWQRSADSSFPMRGKITGGYITTFLAKTEAKSRGFDDAIMFNRNGKISEGTGMNVFMVRNGKLITPSVTEDILEGITRRSVLEIAKKKGLEVEERQVDRSELLIADEVFLTGTAARITPVNRIENYQLPSSRPIADDLIQTFGQITSGKLAEYSDWMTRIKI
jgi:branched-chain amino acid aminotransferase